MLGKFDNSSPMLMVFVALIRRCRSRHLWMLECVDEVIFGLKKNLELPDFKISTDIDTDTRIFTDTDIDTTVTTNCRYFCRYQCIWISVLKIFISNIIFHVSQLKKTLKGNYLLLSISCSTIPICWCIKSNEG